MLQFELVNNSKGIVNVTSNGNQYILNYPCNEPHDCTEYHTVFPPGLYLLELYGASGGGKYITTKRAPDYTCENQDLVSLHNGNTECIISSSLGGAGGYTSGFLRLHERTDAYIAIGGAGVYSWTENVPNDDQAYLDKNRPKGGFNGGGKAASYIGKYSGAGSGGGATDIRILENDLFHRVVVAGGGGGTDNYDPDLIESHSDDGSGGAGGNMIAQGFWIKGEYNGNHLATQTYGFSFGNGEAPQKSGSKHVNGSNINPENSDVAGAGGGWYGGFASNSGSGGAGGGSSFVLTKTATLPSNPIKVYDDMYNEIDEGNYFFTVDSIYTLTRPVFVSGIWSGNGRVIITRINSYNTCYRFFHISFNIYIYIYTIILIKFT